MEGIDNTIPLIKQNPVDSVVCFINTYPLESRQSIQWVVQYPPFKQLGPELLVGLNLITLATILNAFLLSNALKNVFECIKVYHCVEGRLMFSLEGHTASVQRCMFFNQNQQLLLTASLDGTLKVKCTLLRSRMASIQYCKV